MSTPPHWLTGGLAPQYHIDVARSKETTPMRTMRSIGGEPYTNGMDDPLTPTTAGSATVLLGDETYDSPMSDDNEVTNLWLQTASAGLPTHEEYSSESGTGSGAEHEHGSASPSKLLRSLRYQLPCLPHDAMSVATVACHPSVQSCCSSRRWARAYTRAREYVLGLWSPRTLHPSSRPFLRRHWLAALGLIIFLLVTFTQLYVSWRHSKWSLTPPPRPPFGRGRGQATADDDATVGYQLYTSSAGSLLLDPARLGIQRNWNLHNTDQARLRLAGQEDKNDLSTRHHLHLRERARLSAAGILDPHNDDSNTMSEPIIDSRDPSLDDNAQASSSRSLDDEELPPQPSIVTREHFDGDDTGDDDHGTLLDFTRSVIDSMDSTWEGTRPKKPESPAEKAARVEKEKAEAAAKAEKEKAEAAAKAAREVELEAAEKARIAELERQLKAEREREEAAARERRREAERAKKEAEERENGPVGKAMRAVPAPAKTNDDDDF